MAPVQNPAPDMSTRPTPVQARASSSEIRRRSGSSSAATAGKAMPSTASATAANACGDLHKKAKNHVITRILSLQNDARGPGPIKFRSV